MVAVSKPPSRAAVIFDVARLAGVSHQTVSRVLNDHPSVRLATRERVMDAIRQLNYRPNVLARGLAGRPPRMLGVVSFDTIHYGPAATLTGIERAARAAGYGVGIVALEQLDHTGVVSALDVLSAQAVSAVVIIAPLLTATTALRGLKTGVPVVVVDSDSGGELPTVSVDHVTGARLAVEHLLELGHQTIWHVSGPHDWREARDRVNGWRATLEAAGRPVPPVIEGDWSARSGYDAGVLLAGRQDVTAVFCANDRQALGLLRAMHERGVRVPEDVSVVGFDDVPDAAYLMPPLTTVRQDFDEVGRRCLAMLLEEVAEMAPGDKGRSSRVAPTLVRRASTAQPR